MPDRHVSVVIVNWNNWRDTIECLDSIARLEYPSYQVLVCDNGSTDDSVARIQEWGRGPGVSVSLVQMSTGTNLGFAGGNNLVLRHLLATHAVGYVWLLNNDMVVAPTALRRMIEVAEGDPEVGCVGATLLEYREPDVVQAAGGGRLVRWQGLPRPHSAWRARRGSPEATHPDRLDFVTMGCLLAPMTTLQRVGLIDERFFMYCEDIDYSLRIRAAGLRLALAPDAEVWHKGGASIGVGSPSHDYNMVKSSLLLVRKFYPHLLPVAFGYSVFRCMLPKVVRGQWTRLAAVLRGYRDVARGGGGSGRGKAARPL